MKSFEEAKSKYEQIEIPEELSQRVEDAILQADVKAPKKKVVRFPALKGTLAAAAAVVVMFTAGVNVSPVFADSMASVPVVGKVASVLTFTNTSEDTKAAHVNVEIPEIKVEGTSAAAEKANAEIKKACEAYAQKGKEDAAAYEEAFVSTGGTEEEFAAKNLTVRVGYEVKFMDDTRVSFVVNGTEDWVASAAMTKYYTIDLSKDQEMSLASILGEDWKNIANEKVTAYIDEQKAAGNSLFTDGGAEFTGVDENTSFYLNAEGQPVVVLDKYEVAAGAAGNPEIVLSK